MQPIRSCTQQDWKAKIHGLHTLLLHISLHPGVLNVSSYSTYSLLQCQSYENWGPKNSCRKFISTLYKTLTLNTRMHGHTTVPVSVYFVHMYKHCTKRQINKQAACQATKSYIPPTPTSQHTK